jgi:hypothetical protein
VSFDLYVFPVDGPRTVADVHQLMDEEEQRLLREEDEGDALPPPPGPEMERFLAELEANWPGLDDDPDSSPWSSWPLLQPIGGGTALNIQWSRADEMRAAVIAVAQKCNVVVFDPQTNEFVLPEPGQKARRGLFKRRS